MGLGLDRLLMLRKGLPDIRLLRSDDPRVKSQLLDLERYRPVSTQPALRRDLSLVVDRSLEAEEIGDLVRRALGARASAIEADHGALRHRVRKAAAGRGRAGYGIVPGFPRNLVLRVVLRELERTLTSDEANQLRDRVYAALHRGTRAQWGPSSSPGGRNRGHRDRALIARGKRAPPSPA